MQQSVIPELAHTHPRPIHWLATATALAGVVAATSLVGPHATAAQSGPATTARAPRTPAVTPAAPDTAAVTFPLDCGPAKTLVQKQATGDLDGDHRPETVAAVRCDAGSGAPPNGVYVITGPKAAGGEPRVVATLVDPAQKLTVTELAVRAGAVTATMLGYSTPDVPSCCPDIQQKAKWQWHNGAFVRSTPSGAHSV